MALSIYGANLYASVILRGTAAPTSMYLALLNTLPAPEEDGTDIAAYEPTGGYARILVPTGLDWSVPVDGFSQYDTAFTFTPTANWGVMSAYALCTALTAGEVLMYGYLATAVTAQQGANVQIPANALSVGLVV